MTTKEVDQIAIFASLKEKTMKQKDAAKQLGLSVRQVKRKLKAYKAAGAASLVHAARGKPSNRQLSSHVKDQALTLIAAQYPDFGPTFAAEKLAENHGITLDHETLRRAMVTNGMWHVKQRRYEQHCWRERRARYGELVQLDGSPHDWFEGRGPTCTLLAFIDDATSTLLWAEFADSESTETVMQATWHYLEKHGKPVSLYTDRGGVFKVNLGNKENERKTQYERALAELGVELIHARSPQAKGRVERGFGTHQDRLVKELRLAGISTLAEANIFLVSYMAKHNQRFAVTAREPTNLHRPVTRTTLREALCQKEERLLHNDQTIQYKTDWFLLDKKQSTILRPKDKITVTEYLDGELGLSIRSVKLTFTKLPARPVTQPTPMSSRPLKQSWTPPVNHPWRQYKQTVKVTFLKS